MKVSKDFILRQIMDDYMLIPMGEAALEISAILTTNEVGAFLWECLSEETTFEELVQKLVGEFEVEEAVARTDVQEFLDELAKHGLVKD